MESGGSPLVRRAAPAARLTAFRSGRAVAPRCCAALALAHEEEREAAAADERERHEQQDRAAQPVHALARAAHALRPCRCRAPRLLRLAVQVLVAVQVPPLRRGELPRPKHG